MATNGIEAEPTATGMTVPVWLIALMLVAFFWGALTFDLLLAVLVTSAFRHRIGFSSWRFVHWLAYLCWPIALFHALGSAAGGEVISSDAY